MAKKALYQHHERTTIAAALSDAQSRELVAGSGSKEVVYKWNDGTTTRLNSPVFNVKDYGAVGDGVSNDYAGIAAAIAAAAANGSGVIQFGSGTFVFGTTITLTATNNGITFRGISRFDTILKYTGTGDGFSMGGNLNGLTMEDMRLYSLTGRDALVFSQGAASGTPDAGVVNLARLDIRDWLRHGIKARLTVDLRTDHLEVVQNGGCGIYIDVPNPYRATTWTDTGSWFHENVGHGIVTLGTFSQTLLGTISDSNTGLSTDADTLAAGGYTMTGGGVYTSCVAADIGKTVTQGGVTLGTLAHYDNTTQEWVINCTATPATSGALAITTGTGASTTTATRQKNSHGLFTERSTGLIVQGGHYENHIYGIFASSLYDSFLKPGYILTQGTNAWGIYLAGTSTRVTIPLFAGDVQAGGAGILYAGVLTIGCVLGKPGAYTTTIRSLDYISDDTPNAGSTVHTIKSTSLTPLQITGTNATETFDSVTNTSAAGLAGRRISCTGFTKDYYIDPADGHTKFKSSGLAKYIYWLGSATDRANQRLFWTTSTGVKAISIGPTEGVRAGSDVESDYTVDLYDDSGTLLTTGLKIARSTRIISIPAGKSTATKNLSGVWKTDVTSTGSVNAAETDLYSVSVPLNLLINNGDSLEFFATGTYAANGNTKRLKAYFGATQLLNTGALVLNGATWAIRGTIMRVSNTSQIASVTFSTNVPATGACESTESEPAETLSGAVTFRITGTATTTNDIVRKVVKVTRDSAGT